MDKMEYKKDSIKLWGAIGLGTGVMFGAGIFAVLGQVAELARSLFPLSYVGGAFIALFSSYGYIKMANRYPSAGGIGMFFTKIYGKGVITASSSLLMAFSMIIAQSLVARTFGIYTLQIFDVSADSLLVPILGVGLLLSVYFINIKNNEFIQSFTSIISLLKIIGILLLVIISLRNSGISQGIAFTADTPENYSLGLLGSMALSLLSFKGFTTITNSGAEIVEPNKNIGRAISISIALLSVLYFTMSISVSSSLSITQIVAVRDYSLAEAARPTLGDVGRWATIGIAIMSTVTVCIGSVFAVSRMTAMLTDMHLIPHSHFGMKGTIQRHMLVYIIVIGIFLTMFFDLGRIASLGAMFYIFMDIIFQFGLLKKKKEFTEMNVIIISISLIFDAIIFGAFLLLKAKTDLMVAVLGIIFITLIFIGEKIFLRKTLENGRI